MFRKVHISWLLPLLLYSHDACAWGLFTHAYFGQLLIWGIPIADRRFRNAIKQFPELLLAGACLPDLAMFGQRAGTTAFDATHKWESASRLLESAQGDKELAMALGYCSHLFVDIIAHNHFVPAHEKMWGKRQLITHAFCEWAMDAHIMPHLFHLPDRLLLKHKETLSSYMAANFGAQYVHAEKSLTYLAVGVRALRMGAVLQLCHAGAKTIDAGLSRRFAYYVKETSSRLSQINRILAGEAPAWHAELDGCEIEKEVAERIDAIEPYALRHRIPLPASLFQQAA